MDKVKHVQRLLNSLEKLTGENIIKRTTPKEDLKKIERGEFVLVSHNTAEDPILNYGNPFALKLWELNWEEFTKTPSRNTTEHDLREKRQKMLKITEKQGYFDQYEGIRVSASGKRFKIKNAIIWNVLNESNFKIGQAAFFNEIQYL